MKYTVKNGIDRFDEICDDLKGARIGLITNPTGVDKNQKSTVDIMFEHGNLSCLFAPEHGIRGDAQAGESIANGRDVRTGTSVHSLYGGDVHIDKAVLKDLDAVAFDIQDVGARYYTYVSTLAYAMEDCAESGKRMIVFDRINPIGGETVEGTVLDTAFSSFVGRYPVATRHGLTVGEYAAFINDTEGIGCDLTVVKAQGWSRGMYFVDTDLKWTNPSPNMPSLQSAICYIGTCLCEGTNMSEGRGTDIPFQVIGSPWLDSKMVANEINRSNPLGVKLHPVTFTPTFSKYAGRSCNGIRFEITDKSSFRPFKTVFKALEYIRQTHKDFAFLPSVNGNPPFIDLLLGTDDWRMDGFDADAFFKKQSMLLDEYAKKTKKYLLY